MPACTNAEDEVEAELEIEAELKTQCVAHIDDAVSEVFALMLRHHCVLVAHPKAIVTGISASILFSGTLEGQCTVHVSIPTADRITDALLGTEGDWDDEMLDDAVGELCNMIAGGWKSRLGPPASVCRLSVPTVSRSRSTNRPHTTTTRRFYTFNGSVFEVALALN
jgi:chemotaxis protein CheX